jgi:ABC-type polysaccharide/polyol phosphate export permease
LIDVAIPSDKNVIQKEAENKLKYKSLSIGIQRMWNMKCFAIPVIIWATGIVSKSLQKYLETIPEQHSIDSLQQTAILRSVLRSEDTFVITCVANLMEVKVLHVQQDLRYEIYKT